MATTGPRFVELVRVSTRAQSERDTPEAQRRALDALRVNRPGLLVERIEEIGGISGAAKERPDLLRLAALSVAHAYDEIRVWAVDRLTRAEDPRDRMAVLGYALDAGAVIVDCAGRTIDPRQEIGEIDFYLQTLFSARERKRILERTMAGKRRVAALGHHPSGQTPWGLRWDKAARAWSVDTTEAATYRRIVASILGGASLRDVANELRAERVASRNGGTWVSSNVHRLLTNPAAYGRWDVLGLTLDVPPLVTREEWDAVQARLSANRCGGRPATYPAMLRRLMVCGGCGSGVVVASRVVDRKGGRGAYYACGCQGREVRTHVGRIWYKRVETVDEAVRGEVRRFLESPEMQRRAVDALSRRPARDWPDVAKKAAQEDARLAATEARILALLESGVVSEDSARARLSDLKARRAEAHARQAEAEREAMAGKVELHDVATLTARVAKRLRTATLGDWAEVCGLLFPRGSLRFYADRIEGEGRLCLSEVPGNSTQIRQFGQAVPFRLLALVA